MQYTLTFLEDDYTFLINHLLNDRTTEKAAYLLCGISASELETRLLVRQVIPVDSQDIESATAHDLVIRQDSYRRVLKQANESNTCFVLVHSHPDGYVTHSQQDDREEPDLFKAAYSRIHNANVIHASVVISDPQKPRGRVWLPNGKTNPISRIRIIGRRFSFLDPEDEALIEITLFNRQILAFGDHIQKLLSRLHIGIVGLGGTGSAVCEQLVRLGVGRLTVCDPQAFEATNINRVYGSLTADEGVPKAEIARRSVKDIGIGTKIESIAFGINDLATAKAFKNCDIIFGCTDDEWGRSILTKLAVMYLVPIFDLGVEIDSENKCIKSVRGRVTVLMPGSACLFCRGAITADIIGAEVLHATNPDEYEKRKREGYVPGLPDTAPAVITFTSSVASAAISEMIHRLTGFMGTDHTSTELILRFDELKFSTNSKPAKAGCWCSDAQLRGKGDVDLFLGLTWVKRA